MVKSNDSFKSEWKINNFSNLGVDWYSEEFTVGDHKWKLWLFPKGNQQNRGHNISIFLVSVHSKDFDHYQKLKANYSICINDQIKGGGHKRFCCTWFSTTRTMNNGYPGFMPLTQLHDEE
ncbi:MATH domain and coiled-coil domain-containing protein At2g05420-like [Lycium barbarum]|uniref:MATH domain and coiled-coil domain-containing protein At2g05420-like n=1 Tax=Lycium barbarum TaxID=112863 RepID=UPI00293F4627|nr:MATH domain and coiled-coil domain-containing protein At2g05420-like [Lycium barbarum]